jgi:hypothetical protein
VRGGDEAGVLLAVGRCLGTVKGCLACWSSMRFVGGAVPRPAPTLLRPPASSLFFFNAFPSSVLHHISPLDAATSRLMRRIKRGCLPDSISHWYVHLLSSSQQYDDKTTITSESTMTVKLKIIQAQQADLHSIYFTHCNKCFHTLTPRCRYLRAFTACVS